MTTAKAREIAVATSEQAKAATQIVQAATQMRKGAKEVSQANGEQARAAREIIKAAQNDGLCRHPIAQSHDRTKKLPERGRLCRAINYLMRKGAASTVRSLGEQSTAIEQVARETDRLITQFGGLSKSMNEQARSSPGKSPPPPAT